MAKQTRTRTINRKQQAFIDAYMYDDECKYNGAKSAIKAGYSAKTAKEIASQLLAKPLIKLEVERIEADRRAKLHLNEDQIIEGISSIATNESEQSQARLKAYELLGKTKAMFTDKVIERDKVASDTDKAILTLLTSSQVIQVKPEQKPDTTEPIISN